MNEPIIDDWESVKQRGRAEAQERIQQQANDAVEQANSEGSLTPAQASEQTEVQRPDREEGFVTRLGERVKDFIDAPMDIPAGLADRLNEVVGDDNPLKGATEYLDDNVLNADEYTERLAESSVVGEALAGANEGIKAGILTPATVAGRLTNQATPWSYVPQVLEDSAVGSAAFNIAEVMVPSLVAGIATGGLATPLTGGAVGLVAESALETAVQSETNDDLIAGRTVARGFGEIADSLGYDGGALTAELIAGGTPKSQAFTAVMGMLQNMGINFGVNQLVRVLRPKGAVKEATEQAEEIIQPNYKPDAEPHEVLTVDTVSPTAPPSAGRQYINDEVLTPDYIRNIDSDSPYFTAGDRRVFASLDQVSTREGMDNLLNETVKRLDSVKGAVGDSASVKASALRWWSRNADLIRSGDYDAGASSFASDADLVRTTRQLEGVEAKTPSKGAEDYLRERASTTPEGALASALVGDVMGRKGIKLSTLANNLDTNGIDFTNVVDEFARLTDKYSLFSIPERRDARNFFLSGDVRQRARIESAKNSAGIENVPNPSTSASIDAPGRAFDVEVGESGSTFSELWSRAQSGDYDALNTVKEYLRAVAVMPPESALSGIAKLENVAAKKLAEGNADAASSLMYASRITSISTQAVSAGSTVARFLAEPIGNIVSPVFARGSMSDVMYGIGAIKGSFSALADGMRIARQTFASEIPINSGSKFDDGIRNSAKKAAQMDAAIKEFRSQMAREGKSNSPEALSAEIQYNMQRFGNSPINRLGARLLTAGDDGFKVALGTQIANGRAYRAATEAGKLKDLDSFIKVEMDRVFREGVEKGRITDGEVIQAGKNLTFQDDIPMKGNAVDRVFESAQNFANTSGVGKLFFPFVRAAYTSLEVTARYEPSGVLRAMVPKYRRILNEVNPTTGLPTARAQQLQGQVAFGRLTTLTFAGAAYFGNVTGYNHPDPKMRTKILIPYNNKDGFIAIDYGRMEPFASIIGVTADLVNSYKEGALSEGDLQRFASELVFSTAMASTDKTFMQGLLDLGALANYKNADGRFVGTVKDISQDLLTLPFGAVGALSRQGGRILAPNNAIRTDDTNPMMDYFRGLKGRVVAGVGDPVRHDIFSGEPIKMVPDSGNPIVNSLGALINQSLPINITASRQSPVIKELGRLGMSVRDIKTDEWRGVPLSPQQQSDFTKAIAEAGLEVELDSYFTPGLSRYSELREAMGRNRSWAGTTGKGTTADRLRQQAVKDVKAIIKEVMERAAEDSLYQDNDYLQRQYGDSPEPLNKSLSSSPTEDLISMKNK